MADDKIKERIRRMLALAEDEGTTQGERDVALARATELITAHQLDRAMFDRAADITEEIISQSFTFEGSYTKEKSRLLGWLAEALGMKSVIWHKGKKADRALVYGFASDVELLDMLYTSLLLQQVTGLRKAKPPRYLVRNEVAAWRRDWLTAFSTAVSHRVQEAHSRAAQTYDREHAGSGQPGAELVLSDRSDQVAQVFEEEHPGLKKFKPRQLRHVDALRDGRDAGQRADIGLTKVGERRAQIGAGR